VSELGRGQKRPDSVAGAPFPPATDHDDGPPERPRRDVPSADTPGAAPQNDTEVEPEEEPDGP
jgi:hypothetical protein